VIELHLEDRVEFVAIDPWTDPDLRRLNPLAKVPTLVTDDGRSLFESTLICEYLDHLAGGRLFPPPGEKRWSVLLRQGVADGVSAAACRLFADEQRPEEQRIDSVMRRQAEAVLAGLDRLEGAEPLSDLAHIDAVAAACALGYLDFRWPDQDWRAGRPRLADWHARVSRRDSLIRTAHHIPG
jgi:glutathione S-transferase